MQKLLTICVMLIVLASAQTKLCARLYDNRERTGAHLAMMVSTNENNLQSHDIIVDGDGWPRHNPGTKWVQTDYNPYRDGWDWDDRVSSVYVAPDCLLEWREHPHFRNGAWGFIGCQNPTGSCGGNNCNGQSCRFNNDGGWGNWMSYFRCSCKLKCGASALYSTRGRYEWPQSTVVYRPDNCYSNDVPKRHRTSTCYGEWSDWGDMSHYTASCPSARTPTCSCENGTPKSYAQGCRAQSGNAEIIPRDCLRCNAGHTMSDDGESCIQTAWGAWSSCSKQCKYPERHSELEWVQIRDTSPGVQTRTRGCGGTVCDGEEIDERFCYPEDCVVPCDQRWCNNRGTVSDADDRDGCTCECNPGWSSEVGAAPHNLQCTIATLCSLQCYDIQSQEECEITGVYTGIQDCPQCYWHGDIMGCLNKGEYVIGWDIDLDYDPSNIPLEAVQAHSYRYVYTYSNLSPEEIHKTDFGHSRDMTETISYVEEETALTKDGNSVSWEDFKRNVQENMERETNTSNERDEWHEEKVNRKLRSHTVEIKACMSTTVSSGSVGPSASATSETCATNNNHWEDEETLTRYEGGSLEIGSESTGEQTRIWERNHNKIRQDWSGDERSALEMTENSLTTFQSDQCIVGAFTVPALSTYEVFITYSKASYQIEAEARATITTTRRDSDQMTRSIIVDFGTVISMETHSECDVQARPAGFITEKYDCYTVQNAITVANLEDSNTFLPRCMVPPHLYEPTQHSHKSKWCSTPRGEKQADTVVSFEQTGTVVAPGILSPTYGDPDDYPLDCSNQLSTSQLCNVTQLDLGSTLPYSSTIQVPLRGYASSDLLESYTNCRFSFPGLQELVKVVIPPRTQIWLKVNSDVVDATLIGRFGDLCPGMSEPTESFEHTYVANDNQQCNPSIALVNSDLDDDFTAYVVIATNALQDMAGSTMVEIEYKTAIYHKPESADCRRNLDWWISNTPRDDVAQWGCEYYESGDNSLECSFDGINTVNGWITAADVCPSCGCEDWRATCPDVTEDWACNCSWDVEDCEGVCAGTGSICVEQCDFDYGMPGVSNIEKQAEISGRRRNIYKGGMVDIDEYPWYVQIGHLGSAHYIDAIPVFQTFSTMAAGDQYSQAELQEAFIPRCGATMIGRSALITAAHCVKAFRWVHPDDEDVVDIEDVEWRRVTHVSLRHGTTVVPIKRIIRHKDFTDIKVPRPVNDIAIIEIEPVPCYATYQAIEIADDFAFEGCTAFATGAGEEFLKHNFAPSVSPVEEPLDEIEIDCTCASDDISNIFDWEDPHEEYAPEYGINDYTVPSDDYASEYGTNDYTVPSDDYRYEYGIDGTVSYDDTVSSEELDCSDFTADDKAYCLTENAANMARRIYENGKLTHGNYPDVGNFKEMITKAWTAQSCNEHHEYMYPMHDALLLNETFCAWTGDYEQHILHPESACSGDSGSGLKIDINVDPSSHYYALLGLVSYGKNNGCAANGVTVFVHLAKYKSWILRVFPEAQFVTPPTCDRRDYYEGLLSETSEGLETPKQYNARLDALGFQNTFEAFAQKYLTQRCPFPLNSRLTLLADGMPRGTVPFVVRTALNFGNGQNSMNSRELATAEREWLEPFYDMTRPYGCWKYEHSVLGKIVFVKRGRCNFSQKFKHAMDANAFAMVVIDLSPSSELVGMQNTPDSGFENIREYGPAMFMRRSDGLRILRLMRNRELKFKMKCADLNDNSLWIDEEILDTNNQLHSVEFCENSPPKDCNREILCAPLCYQETDCAMRVGNCCEYDCTPWEDNLESQLDG